MSSPRDDQQKSIGDSLDRQYTVAPEASRSSGGGNGEQLEARYALVERLGAGGMGEVWRAIDRRLDRPVAIKRLQGELLNCQDALDRFLTEARAVARLNHPGIVQVYDFGSDAQGPYLVMELVEGCSLDDLLERSGPLPPAQAVALIAQVCEALGAAHQQGIIHRDIKPGNILVTRTGQAKLSDFGLARRQAADYRQTQSGAILGTPAFMAPEQYLDPRRADARSDLWSLAAALYQLVTGQLPRMIQVERLPGPLRPVMVKALDDHPDRRYQTAGEFRAALGYVEGQLRSSPSAPREVPVEATVVAAPTRSPFAASTVPGPRSSSAPRRRSTGWIWISLAVVFLVLPAICGGMLLVPFMLGSHNAQYPAAPATVPASPFDVPSNPAAEQLKSLQEKNRQFQEEVQRRIEADRQRNQQMMEEMRNRARGRGGLGGR